MCRSRVVEALPALAFCAVLTLPAIAQDVQAAQATQGAQAAKPAQATQAAQSAPALAGAGRAGGAHIVAPLLADDGTAYAPAHHLAAAEAAAGGEAPGWATRAQAAQIQRAHPQRVLRLRASGGAKKALPSPAPGAWVLVDGAERSGADAVRLARRLADAGAERVWVVLPDSRRADVRSAKAGQGSAR